MDKHQEKSLALVTIEPAVFSQISAAVSVVLGAMHSVLSLLISLFSEGPGAFLSLLPLSLAIPILYGAATFFMTYLFLIFVNKRLNVTPLRLEFIEKG